MQQATFRSIFFIYCLEVQADGSFVALNRKYTPVGLTTRQYTDYTKLPVSFAFKDLTPSIIMKLNCHKTAFEVKPGEKLYLYSDDCDPLKSEQLMQAYLEKTNTLMYLHITSNH